MNFTGGEVFLPQSNLPELVEAARAQKVDVRVNTNGWWGSQENIRLGNLTFRSSGHLVGWLRDMGVAILALSFDKRFKDRPEGWVPTASIIQECERLRQGYQIVCTGVGREGAFALCDQLVKNAGVSPRHLVPMEMIDIGGASRPAGKALQLASVTEARYCVPCEGNGFFRPTILHVAPDGGVRTCLYAPGGGWLGNVSRESLLDIVNRFAQSPVTAAFSNGEIDTIAEALIKSYAHVYRSVDHPCAALAVLARVIEAATVPDPSLCGIHDRIASDLNLHA